jgi:hypothetical protein
MGRLIAHSLIFVLFLLVCAIIVKSVWFVEITSPPNYDLCTSTHGSDVYSAAELVYPLLGEPVVRLTPVISNSFFSGDTKSLFHTLYHTGRRILVFCLNPGG